MATLPSNIAQPLVFQRGDGALRGREDPRRATVRAKHVLGMFCVLAATFFAFTRAYLFLISWDKLAIRSVEVVCARPSLKRDLDRAFAGHRLGNIMLCDIDGLRAQVRSFPWVREARIRKVFPSALRVEIEERVPRARLERYSLTLVDGEGAELGAPGTPEESALPVLADREGFRNGRAEKLRLAWDCLDGLPAEERAAVSRLDLSDLGTVELVFRDDPVRVRLGGREFAGKIRLFRECRAQWEGALGALETVDLRFDDRVY
ncbi:MAG TPA: FtsQ-type POTRA domain-containing protein, partial [Acidobacteriota bacterium]|nr:FtsQ-type POTRA domain-containing protein [Acidobacteriota bacterium]